MARTTNKATEAIENETEAAAPATAEASDTMTLKFVGGDTYHCHAAKPDVIKRDEIITVPVSVGLALLDDVFLDGLNNEHPYFIETSQEEEAAKAKRAARRSAAKVSNADDAGDNE